MSKQEASQPPAYTFDASAEDGGDHHPPPAYLSNASASSSSSPYGANGPKSYTIGGQALSRPLVNIEQVKAHLGLLRALKELRTAVQEKSAKELELDSVVAQLDKDKRWTWFVGLAVERFQRWLETLPPPQEYSDSTLWVEDHLPPIDVLMVWHSYLLNPMMHAEDCGRSELVSRLKLKDRLLQALAQVGDINTYLPSPDRITAWEHSTETPFNPLVAITELTDRRVSCPSCQRQVRVPLITDKDTGYLQPKFVVKCGYCPYLIRKSNLGVAKFATDMSRDHRDPNTVERYGSGVFLATTVHTPNRETSTELATRIKTALYQNPPFKKVEGSPDDVEATYRKRLVDTIPALKDLRVTLAQSPIKNRGGPRRVNRIMGAYTDDRPFSLDLVGAVLRQGSFVDKMDTFGWTQPGYFDDSVDELVLQHTIARYHGFLDLMSASLSFCVPTLDIDLAWHTHQMMGGIYQSDCITYVKRFVDHDDKVEDNYLAAGFDDTCKAWKERFKVPYMYCGCPLPGDSITSSIGQRLSRLTKSLSKSKEVLPALEPPGRSDALLATHPSDHNSILVRADTTRSDKRQERIDNTNKRRERDLKLAHEGKIDKEVVERGVAHDLAFMYPVPFYLPPAITCASSPVGVPNVGGVGGCIVGAGTYYGSTACGTCSGRRAGLGGCGTYKEGGGTCGVWWVKCGGCGT